MRFDLGGDGRLDDSDYLMAYVTGASDWAFDSAGRRYRYDLDRYDDFRTYWLVYETDDSLANISKYQSGGTAARTVTDFTDYL